MVVWQLVFVFLLPLNKKKKKGWVVECIRVALTVFVEIAERCVKGAGTGERAFQIFI